MEVRGEEEDKGRDPFFQPCSRMSQTRKSSSSSCFKNNKWSWRSCFQLDPSSTEKERHKVGEEGDQKKKDWAKQAREIIRNSQITISPPPRAPTIRTEKTTGKVILLIDTALIIPGGNLPG